MRWTWVFVWLAGCSARVGPQYVIEDSEAEAEVAVADSAPYDWNAKLEVPAGEILRCGPGPWMPHRWQWGRNFGDKSPMAGTRFAVDLCPNMWVTAGADGAAMMYVPDGAVYSVLMKLPDDVGLGDREVHGEMLANYPRADAWYALAPMPIPWSKVIDVTEGAIHLMPYVTPDSSIAPCNEYEGTSFEVVGHPEAKVHYVVNQVEVMGATSVPRGGGIWINGLAPGSRVTLRGHKDGCAINPFGIYLEKPGTIRTFPGYFTYYAFQVAALPTSEAGTD
jgi:hypothetical protein